MKTLKYKFCYLFILIFQVFIFNLFAESEKTIDIIFMHDVHSFLNGTARAKTLIDAEKKTNPNVLILDAGDFSMGTLYQTVFSTQATELRVLGKLGVDVTTIGNHEFDYGAEGLASMLSAAVASKDKLPEFVLCNIDWSKNDEYTNILKPAMQKINRRDYVIIKKGELRIAVIGVFGKDAFRCAPTCQLTVLDQIESVKNTVKQIKSNEDTDMIVCVSHCGTSSNKSKSEDTLLAKNVPEIDLIISGHTHTVLDKPEIVGNTTIASCGAYSTNLGMLKMISSDKDRWSTTDYKLIPLDETVPADSTITNLLDKYLVTVDKTYLSQFSYTGKQVLVTSSHNVDRYKEVGYLMAKGVADSVQRLERQSTNSVKIGTGTQIDVAIIPDGVIRGTYNKGDVTVSDVFTSFSLGMGPDKITGYPLVSVYFTGEDLKTASEIDKSLSPLMDTVKLYASGITYSYNPHRLIFDKVTDLSFIKADGSIEKMEKDRLYRTIIDIYTAKMLKGVLALTKGLITVIPRFADGTPIENFEDAIVYMEDNKEIKTWYAIAQYLDRIPSIPDYTNIESELKVNKSSWSPIAILKSPSKIACIIYVLILVIIFIVVVIVLVSVKCRKKGKKNKTNVQRKEL